MPPLNGLMFECMVTVTQLVSTSFFYVRFGRDFQCRDSNPKARQVPKGRKIRAATMCFCRSAEVTRRIIRRTRLSFPPPQRLLLYRADQPEESVPVSEAGCANLRRHSNCLTKPCRN